MITHLPRAHLISWLVRVSMMDERLTRQERERNSLTRNKASRSAIYRRDD
jgi:hypothetical protein